MTKSNFLKRLQEIGIIRRGEVLLRSGQVSDFYCDVKKSFGYPELLNALADEVGAMLPPSVTAIAASGYGGLPLGAVVASRFKKKFIAIRSAEKDHGKGGMIDGYQPTSTDVVVIVDDVLTSGSSIKETLVALERVGATVDSAIVVVKRGDPTLPISYQYIFTPENFSF